MRNISAAGETITRLLGNFLPVGEEDATGIVFQPETKKLANVCEDMLRQMRLDAGENQDLEINVSGDYKKALMDEGVVRRILTNLLSNVINIC